MGAGAKGAGEGEGEERESRAAGGTGRSASARWAVAGVALLLGAAVVRLGGRAFVTLGAGLSAWEWTALGALTTAFVWGEGERALARRWVPHVVRRARGLGGDARPLHRALAPLYAMSLIGAGRSEALRARAGLAAIVAAVLLVRAFPEPWRGIVDFAVAAALAWGVVALVRARVGAADGIPRWGGPGRSCGDDPASPHA